MMESDAAEEEGGDEAADATGEVNGLEGQL